jgi:hypothetical protein
MELSGTSGQVNNMSCGMFKVAAERCENCLFSADRIVDGKRVKQIIEDTRRSDSFFICHKFGTGGDKGLEGSPVCCRGFFDTQNTLPIQLATRLDCVDFIPLPVTEKLLSERERCGN